MKNPNIPQLNPTITFFIDSWKSIILAKAKLYNLPIEASKTLDFRALHAMIEEHENEQVLMTQRIAQAFSACANDNYIGEYEKLIIQKAINYEIPIVRDNLDITQLCLEVEDYEYLLDQAADKLIDWDTSTYDPEGLQLAINQHEEDSSQDWREYTSQVRQLYYATR